MFVVCTWRRVSFFIYRARVLAPVEKKREREKLRVENVLLDRAPNEMSKGFGPRKVWSKCLSHAAASQRYDVLCGRH